MPTERRIITCMNRLIFVVFGILFLTVAADWATPKNSTRILPSAQDLVGAWIGFDKDCVFFYRITLENRGRGKCEVLYGEKSIDSYNVDDWRVVSNKLVVTVSPVNRSSEEIEIRVTYVDHLSLEMNISCTSPRWERKAILFNEIELLRKLDVCKKHLIK
jgi:hypothetical protein